MDWVKFFSGLFGALCGMVIGFTLRALWDWWRARAEVPPSVVVPQCDDHYHPQTGEQCILNKYHDGPHLFSDWTSISTAKDSL